MATDVDMKLEDGIAWVILNRPSTRNARDAPLVEAAIAALDDLPHGARALVLAAQGPAFCVGADLHMFRAATSSRRADERLAPLLVAMHSITRKLRALPIPTVAAVQGAAAGAGVGLAGAAPAALLATRRLVDAAPGHSFDDEEATLRSAWGTADAAEGVAAFVERRRPKFQGAEV